MVQAPAKSRSDVEILIEKLNHLIDERIYDLSYTAANLGFSQSHRMAARARIDELESAKKNVKRLAEEIARE